MPTKPNKRGGHRESTWKIIQNNESKGDPSVGNKMELQINRLETKIEKMREMFNRDLEEIKKSQSIINNAITETKSTVERTNSRITEVEDRISEVEDRMVKINESEREKELKEMRSTSETSVTMFVKCSNIQIIGIPEEEDKKKGHKKILQKIIVEKIPKMGKEIATQFQKKTQNLKQYQSKVKQP